MTLISRLRSHSLVLVLTALTWNAHAVVPQARPGGEPKDAQLRVEVAYMYGLAERINALLGDPEDRTAQDLRLSRAGMNASSVRRSLFAFMSAPWCWVHWPPISRLEYLAHVLRISLDDLVRPDLLVGDFGKNSRFSVADARPKFEGYMVLTLKYECNLLLTEAR